MRTLALVCLVLGAGVSRLAGAQATPDSTAIPWHRTPSGLAYQVAVQGTGPVAMAGDRVTIHETLTLPDGRLIFSSRTQGKPVTFVLGANQVIAGVEEAVRGMWVGERRKVLVPPTLDGRTFDPAFIPPDAIRHYDIELLTIGR
jgi:FKBP-type peptidyl-prolyl cis-trans isomerase